ncbi:MAG: HAMP domain-containing histidine kinase [Bryobacterales bacterium]|nr:HAMP domain-containing histidine kinase [Bryobacterales bacterium]
MFRGTLRNKFLFAFAAMSSLLTTSTLLIVRQRVELRAREEIQAGLRNSTLAFSRMQAQREATLERSAALLAALPPLKAVMTSQHKATIQDASRTFWQLAGSQLFVLADANGAVMALHTASPGFTEHQAQTAITRMLAARQSRDWWYGGGHLFEVFLQPLYFGPVEDNSRMGMLAVGYEIDARVAADVASIASSQVAFQFDSQIVVTTVSDRQKAELAARAHLIGQPHNHPTPVDLAGETYLATTVPLTSGKSPQVALTVLKSYDEATAFLHNLNQWVVGLGIAAVVAGCLLVYFFSTTFTRPLEQLVAGVKALEAGDFAYPLEAKGTDEVSTLTAAFQRMRVSLQEAQTRLIESERLATIGQMASTISHDLRHPLTAILAYAEFLSESRLTNAQRKDFFDEIRIAVNRMTDEINSLLGFSRHRETIRPRYASVPEVVDRAIQNVTVLPEFHQISVRSYVPVDCHGWFDPAKLERVLLNLLHNACEAVSSPAGTVTVSAQTVGETIEIRVRDNGPGIPEAIRESLFKPFVSHGKETGTGLGLTVVQKILQDHGGGIEVEKTGPDGTTFRLWFPSSTRPT